jgi:hypothetical protein
MPGGRAIPRPLGGLRKRLGSGGSNADRPTGAGAGGAISRMRVSVPAYWTAFIMSKIGRYIATTMPPTITPSTTIITGSINERSEPTATSTSSS